MNDVYLISLLKKKIIYFNGFRLNALTFHLMPSHQVLHHFFCHFTTVFFHFLLKSASFLAAKDVFRRIRFTRAQYRSMGRSSGQFGGLSSFARKGGGFAFQQLTRRDGVMRSRQVWPNQYWTIMFPNHREIRLFKHSFLYFSLETKRLTPLTAGANF